MPPGDHQTDSGRYPGTGRRRRVGSGRGRTFTRRGPKLAGGPPGTEPSVRRVRVGQAVERLAASGASFVTASERHGEYCVTMLDPEGNEFDVQ